jgi:hypothetical protein
MTSKPPPPPPPPPAQTDYFQDKRGEINDLKALLRDVSTERDARKKREVVGSRARRVRPPGR